MLGVGPVAYVFGGGVGGRMGRWDISIPIWLWDMNIYVNNLLRHCITV